jgi:hypothetical protein
MITNPWIDLFVKIAGHIVDVVADMLKDEKEKEGKKDDGKGASEKKRKS